MILQTAARKVFFGKTARAAGRSCYLRPKIVTMNIRLALALLALATVSRLVPFLPDNVSPLAAIGLFGAAYFSRRPLLLAVPFAALFLSDLYINNVIYSQFFDGFTLITSWWIYLGFALVMLTGYALLSRRVSPLRVLGASVSGSLLFFLVSNFSTWAETTIYPKTAAGLMMCYTAGLPFLQNTMLGDLFFCAVMFGAYEWAKSRGWQLAGHKKTA
jgi:hypothetical protein